MQLHYFAILMLTWISYGCWTSWSWTDSSPWQYIKVHYVWRPGYTVLRQDTKRPCIYLPKTMHKALLSDKALSLDVKLHFAAIYLSRPPRCHAAVEQFTHYLVSCDSISESFGPGSWSKRGKNSQPPLNSDDRKASNNNVLVPPRIT